MCKVLSLMERAHVSQRLSLQLTLESSKLVPSADLDKKEKKESLLEVVSRLRLEGLTAASQSVGSIL